MEGKKVGSVDLSDSIFAIEPNAAVMHQVVLSYLAAQRQGTQSALTRSEVSGGGRKPWRQKGTGRARQGSTRAPQWTHGGIVFAPKPRDYRFTVNKKEKRLALKSALSVKAAENDIIVVDSITTGEFEVDTMVIKSAANIPGVKTAQVNTINVYDILNADKLIIAKDAVSKIEEVYA